MTDAPAATAARAGQVLAPRLQRGAQRLAGVVVIGVQVEDVFVA